MRAALYCRKSTHQDVDDEAKSVARQEAGGRKFCEARGWEVAQVFTDDAISGYLFAGRREFQAMLRDAEAGAFDAVLFYDLDRFGRNSRRTMEALHRLADAGVEIIDYSTGQSVDLDSFEGETMTFLRSRFAQEEQRKARKRTRDATWAAARLGHVTGGRAFGYRNISVAKHTEREVYEPEARVVRDIYSRFAGGEAIHGIARSLNQHRVKSPRGKAWTGTAVRWMLTQPLYRGVMAYGRTKMLWGRELGKRRITNDDREREKGQLRTDPETWVRVEVPSLRIVDARTARRVDERLNNRASRDVGGRPPKGEKTYLLSGGMLLCQVCGGHFETRHGKFYECATRRRKGTCGNWARLSIVKMDQLLLDQVEHTALSPQAVAELLTTVDVRPDDEYQHLAADLARARTEIVRLVDSVAAGVPASSVASAIQQREAEAARIEARLKAPRPVPLDAKKLRAAITQTAKDWRDVLRSEPRLARALLRRLVGPITVAAPEELPDYIAKPQPTSPEMLERARKMLAEADAKARKAVVVKWSAESRAQGELLAEVQPGRSPRRAWGPPRAAW